MFPGGRPSQNMPGGNSSYPSSYYRDVAAVSNPAWFGNNPAPVPPPVQYPSRAEPGRDVRTESGRNVRAESSRDLLAESYERMRNEMRSLQGESASKHGGGSAAPPPPTMVEEKSNPLTQLLENKDVSLSSLLEAAMDPNIGSSKRTEDPIMKKTILDQCEGKIAQLYRLRISGQGMFFPMTQPKVAKFDGFSTLTYNHPRIEFNMVPDETVWTCPDVVIETKKEEPKIEKENESEEKEIEDTAERNAQKEEKDRNVSNPLDKIEVLDPQPRVPPFIQKQQQQQQQQQQPVQKLNKMLSQPPPPIANVSYPNLSQYRATIPPPISQANPYSVPPPLVPTPMEILAEIEKERRRKEIEIEWDRLMEDKERKERKRKKKKRSRSRSSSSSSRSGGRRSKSHRSRSRYRSRSRGRSSHRRSSSRHRTRDRSREGRYRRRSRSLSLSLSPSRKRLRSPAPLRLGPRFRRTPSPRRRRRSPSFLRSLQHELHREHRLTHSPPRYRLREEYPPYGPNSVPPYTDALSRPREEYPPRGPNPMHPYPDLMPGPPDLLPNPPGLPPQLPPPGHDSYHGHQAPANPPPPGMDDYGRQYNPGMMSYRPMGPGPYGHHPYPWMGPNMRGPGDAWLGPDRPMYQSGPRPPMGPRGPMPPYNQRPPPAMASKGPTTVVAKKQQNLIDITQRAGLIEPTVKKSIVVVDITDDNNLPSAKVDKNVEAIKNISKPENDDEPNPAGKKPTPTEKLAPNKAKVISDLIPPGVSPDRETETRYPNVESEFTRPMRAAFRKMLQPLEKVLDKIRLYQRDSFDFKTIIKSLESGKIEFMGVHTLHDGLLCKLEINREHPDKFFKIVIPYTHVGRLLRTIHSTYHDYSIGKIQRLIDDVFNNPQDFSLSKIVDAMKNCKECTEAEEKERENLRKKEILILGSPESDRMNTGGEPLKDADNKIIDPMVRSKKDHHRQKSPGREDKDRKRQKEGRSRQPSDAGKEGKSKREIEKSRSVKSEQKSLMKEGADTYSKFEDLSVSRKAGDTKTGPSGGSSKANDSVGQEGEDVSKKGVSDGQSDIKHVKTESTGKENFNDKKVSVSKSSGKMVATNVEVQVTSNKKKLISLDYSEPKVAVPEKESGNAQVNSTSKLEPQSKPQQKPVVNPDDFKERVRAVQMGVAPLDSQISDLEGLGKKSSDPALLLKAGMLCRRLPPPSGKGKPEVKIVVNSACLKQMVEIVHTMSALHAPLQKTVTVFNKHFVPIDGLEKVVSEVLDSCAKCSSDVKK